MFASPASETGDVHFDRRSALERLLENHTPSAPEDITRAVYEKWSPDRQAEFNLQRATRIAAGVVIKTPQLDELDKEIRIAEAFAGRDIGRTGVIVNGPPTTGKTTAAFHAMSKAFRRHTLRYPDWKRDGHIPVVFVEVPPGTTAKGIMGRFLRFLEIPFIEKMTLEARTQLVTQQLQRARTSLIVIDEMQNLARLSNGSFESAQAIKNLLNSLKTVPLYVGFKLDDLFSHDDLGAQFAARSTMIRLDRMKSRNAEGKRNWRGLIRAFETQFALFSHPTGTLIPYADYLWLRTGGSISALSRLLTVAALHVVDSEPDEQVISVELLKSIKLDVETEARYDEMVQSNGNAKSDAA
ncbi:TniB family NTP-binding protein [Microbacterium sp. C5A9]|uniref:TniB family NTP-binding protein n=1 Tax=Microbacterium sp. C5A9 TaxID=2736663 RepID=UPI001F527996|nr:TniB family NTP-binding protein [Microbacterium sp. C5A9]MCI1017363.1 TniB family NTP-binding protein [Microbacterium sp. C5A9]